jgi:hypothetical protein
MGGFYYYSEPVNRDNNELQGNEKKMKYQDTVVWEKCSENTKAEFLEDLAGSLGKYFEPFSRAVS